MRALLAQGPSGPSGLVYTDADDPVSDEAVIIDVDAAGVCFRDLLLRGEYQLRLDPRFIPGMEVAATVRSAAGQAARLINLLPNSGAQVFDEDELGDALEKLGLVAARTKTTGTVQWARGRRP